MVIASKEFVFKPGKTLADIIHFDNTIFDWMDTYIVDTAYIQFDLKAMYVDEKNRATFIYNVISRNKLNCEYMWRHLALQPHILS